MPLKKNLLNLFKLLRIKQWIKNSFVFAALIFSGNLSSLSLFLLSLKAFILFCLISSCVYIFNDLIDLKRDKLHPVKSIRRPLASNAITVRCAITMMVAILLVVFNYLIFINYNYSLIYAFLTYLFINILYSIKLKHIPIVDVSCIAAGFLIRIYAGAFAIDVKVSDWMVVTVLALALYLALGKRKQELVTNKTYETRPSLDLYTLKLIEQLMLISSILSITFYSIYVLTENPHLVISIPLVIMGFFRYYYLNLVEGLGESPTEIVFKDIPLILICLTWIGVCLYGI